MDKINKNILSNTSTLQDEMKLSKFRSLTSYYQSNVKGTFACCGLVTTISKERIFLPINEYDIIGRARCSTEIMNKIDVETEKLFKKTVNH